MTSNERILMEYFRQTISRSRLGCHTVTAEPAMLEKSLSVKAKIDMTNQSWYQNGLRFECRQCGRCCVGEPGFVWVHDNEITVMSAKLGLSWSVFLANFVRNVGNRKSLVELPNGDCIFFDQKTRSCMVYEERPVQCRTWPFWDSNIDTENSWKKTAKFCPGCNKGDNHTVDEIDNKRHQREL